MVPEHAVRALSKWLVIPAALVAMSCEQAMEPADPNAKMREIYFLSFLPGQVQPVETYVLQALDQQQQLFTPEQLKIGRQVVSEATRADKLEALTVERLAEQPQREFLDEGLEWLKTPPVRKFMALAAATWTADGMDDMKQYFLSEAENPPSDERMALIERYDQATNYSGLSAETMLLAAYGVAVMHDSLQPVEERVGPKKLQDEMATQRPVLTPIFKETSIVAHKFAFSQSTDEEVKAIVEFAESIPGQWLYTTISTTFLNAVLEATANLGGQFVAALPEEQPAP